jgi:ribonuclease HI
VSWTSKRQSSVALSSAEAEYMAITETAKEILWLRYLLAEIIGHELDEPSVLCCDNQASISISKNDQHHSRTKHIDYKHHFIRECVNEKKIEMRWVPTHTQHADIFTKALSPRTFANISQMIMKSNITY